MSKDIIKESVPLGTFEMFDRFMQAHGKSVCSDGTPVTFNGKPGLQTGFHEGTVDWYFGEELECETGDECVVIARTHHSSRSGLRIQQLAHITKNNELVIREGDKNLSGRTLLEEGKSRWGLTLLGEAPLGRRVEKLIQRATKVIQEPL